MVRKEARSCILVVASSALLAGAHAQAAPGVAVPQRVTGRVIDEHGKPIAGAAVGVFGANDFVDTSRLLAAPPAASRDDGTFAIEVDGTHRWGRLVVTAAGRQSCALQITEPMISTGGGLGDTLLPPGAKLVGRARDEQGAPLAGVRVRVESSIADLYSYERQLLAGAISDERGIFAVPGVPRTGMRVIAEADGCLVESRLVAQESPCDLSLRRVGMVRGRVVDAQGEPVVGAHVYPVTAESRTAGRNAVTGEGGVFAINVPTRGRFRIAAGEQVAPHRQFRSALLHGPADDVVVTDRSAAAGARTVAVTVVDAATKARIAEFSLAEVHSDPGNLQIALFHSRNRLRAYQDQAEVKLDGADQVRGLIVAAAGHGFEVVPLPVDGGALQVELGAEAVLTGRVIDAETGAPMAGVAVRALPKGNSSGTGGLASDAGPLSDSSGNYRVAGLRPGEYGVQAHAEGRPASRLFTATLKAGDNQLDVEVPKPRWIEVELTGTLPDGPACQLRLGRGVITSGSHRGTFEHSVAEPAPIALTRLGKFRLGPLGRGRRHVEVHVPSRARVATGTTIQLEEVDPDKGPVTIALPDLAHRLVEGRLELPPGVPSERIAVAAWRAVERRRSGPFGERPNLAGVDGGGRFALDLPAGPYTLQLVDLQTGIVFHTEEQDLVVGKEAMAIRPEIHWLEIECVPERAGAEVVVRSFGVSLPRPRGGACGAFLGAAGRDNDLDNSSVEFQAGVARQRWLVPAGNIEIKAWQSFEMLLPWPQSYRSAEVARASLDIAGPEQRVTMTIPAPPPDEELEKAK